MRFRIPFLRALALPALLGALFLAACHLGGEEKVEATISFNQIFDSLKQYDHVVISLKDDGGNTIDVVFDGQVKIPGDVEKLAAPHWDGGPITVSIVGYKEGKIVYNTETGFDGRNNKKDSTYVFVDPIMGLAYAGGAIPMLEGDSINLPTITITPANLKVKTLNWVSSAPDVVRIGATGLKALKAGNAQITVSMVADPAKQSVISVTVVDPAKIPESLALSADTLKLSAGGAPGRLELQFIPTTSAKDVVWSTLDTNTATVAADGTVQGRKAGETSLIVTSSLKASASDTAVIVVTQPQPPEKVVFAKSETEIFVGGAAESLLVAILPPEANQEVEFSVTTPLLIELNNGRISGLAAGDGLVIAKSKENGSLLDTLNVKITVKQVVTSVTLSKKSLLIFTGGDQPILTAVIMPSTSNQKVQWRSGQSGIAKVSDAGQVTGLAPGHTVIYAISLVDSTMQDSADITVKTDAPVINIGRPDTTVSVGSSVTFLPVVPVQEFGVVAAFRWDVDGIAGWDDTAKVVQAVPVKFDQEKEYTLRFYVRDSEGNETIAIKKVSAVIGPVVTIVEPADGAYFTKPAIKIVWKIDNAIQTTGTDTVLKDGANIITRSAKDAAGKVFPASVTVYLDSVPPAKPTVKGPAGIASGKPTWTWSPGGGGNGTYRIAVDSQVFVGPEIKDTLYIPATALPEGVHTLYVQERDAAGNWSLAGKVVTVVDRSGPNKPSVKINVVSPSNTKKPTWTWATGGGAGSGVFQYKFNSPDFSSGASTPAADTQFVPGTNLGDGLHTLYVRERDSLGNWSELGNAAITIDTTAPGAPKILASTPTSSAPKWTWSSGGGGNGTYRFKVGGDPTTSAESPALEYTLTGAVSKTTYTLNVQERDAVGNWSPVANLPVYFDLSKPVVTFTAPQISGTYLTKLGTANITGTSTSPQGAGTIKSVTYSVDGVAGTLSTNMAGDGGWSINALPLTNNKTIAVKVTATDVADNIGEATLNILWDNTAPATPAFTAQPPAIVNKADTRTSLAWTWSQPAGTDSFVVKLNGAEVSRQVGTTHTVNSISDGTYLLEVSGKDMTGNSSAFTPAASVLVDRIAPMPPAFTAQPNPSVVNKADLRTSLSWTWTRTGAATDSFLVSLNGSVVSRQTGQTYSVSPIPDGIYDLEVVEKDLAGNPANALTGATVTVDRAVPGAPTFTAQPNPSVVNMADSRTSLSWTWGAVAAADTFVVRLNGSDISRQTGTTYTIGSLSEGTYVVEVESRDKNRNASGFTAATSVLVDRTAPNAPNLSKPVSPSRTAAWSWTTGGGGKLSYECKLDGGSAFNCTSAYTLTPSDGEHTLSVRELDAAANPSAWASTSVVIDLQKPIINLNAMHKLVPNQIFSHIPDFGGTVSDDRQLKSVHAVWGNDSTAATGTTATGTSNWVVPPALPAGTRTLIFRAQDFAGNQASVQIDVTYEPLVIFVRPGSNGDGTSWGSALNDLGPLMLADKSYPAGTSIWVSEGTYFAPRNEQDPNLEGFLFRNNTSLYGGFASEGTDRSTAARSLSTNQTVLKGQPGHGYLVRNSIVDFDGNTTYTDNFKISGFKLTGARVMLSMMNAKKAEAEYITVQNENLSSAIEILGSNAEVRNVTIQFNTSVIAPFYIGAYDGNFPKVRISDSYVGYNHPELYGGLWLYDATVCATGNSKFEGNDNNEVIVEATGQFQRTSTVGIGANGIKGANSTVGSCPAPF